MLLPTESGSLFLYDDAGDYDNLWDEQKNKTEKVGTRRETRESQVENGFGYERKIFN